MKHALDTQFCSTLPFSIYRINSVEGTTAASSLRCLDSQSFDYVILFDSSGMYRGEEIVKLAALLNHGHFEAIWGSRRLSVKNKYKSSPLYYRYNMALRALRYCGSHMLSLAYLLLYGHYISDALSGVRAMKVSYLQAASINTPYKSINQHILALLLRDKAAIVEIPVQFFPLSPAYVRRTTVRDGLHSLVRIIGWRFTAR